MVLSEPDVFDDIVERVLPKYINADVSSIPQHEHVADIQKILRAMGSDSEAGKKKVVRAARQTPFLKAVDRSGGAAFKKPGGIYLPTHQLTDYFLGSPGGWFLNETEGEQEWHELGVAKKPRFKRILIDLAWDEKSRLRGNQGHTRDIETIDYDLDGLDNFLARFPADQQFKRYSLIVWNFLLQHLKESSYYRFYEGEYRWFYYQERSACFDATWMKRLRSHAWMPKNGTDIPHKPGELSLSDLPEQFERNEKLADLLGIKKDVVAKLAEAAGIPIEDIDLLKRYPEEFSQWKAQVAAQNERPEFPTRTVRNPERRQERLTEELTDALEKEYEPRVRSVRITEATPYTRTWLRNQYTNDAGQMVCQICKEEMPFKKPDDQYYFEAVEIIKQLHIEREELFLALCPTCAAKYKVFVKNDKERTDKLIESILGMEGLEIPVQLDKFRASIHFVEAHLDDLKIILLQSKSIGDGRTKSSETELKLPLVSASTQGELVAERKSQPKVIYKKKGVSAEDPKELVQCPHCPQGAPPVRADRLAKHIRRVHGIAPDQTFFGSAVVSPKIVRRKTRRKKSFKGPIGSGVRRCRICGTPAVPGSDYCYGCG
ncbi:MAG: hypothetical protein H8E17_07580 [Deltaproteobacteria bacterium]|nr:hypothetical protein [Deltaproteobacteria bacterium]